MRNLALTVFDVQQELIRVLKTARDGGQQPVLKSKVPVPRIKRLMRERGLALDEAGRPSWFYRAYHRGDSDPLTNYTLDLICRETRKDANLLITGCGTGIMLFFLMDHGFENVEGFDYLPECVTIANDVAALGGYNTKIWQADGFHPSLERSYDLITAMHWVFSAWGGNYGNDAISIDEAKKPETRERLLLDFLAQYAPHLNPGGRMIVELTDAVADYRVPKDGGIKEVLQSSIYPVRHTPEQVQRCAAQQGLKVVSYKMCCSYGHQPRTSYILEKSV